MRSANDPSNEDFQKALEVLFPKYLETNVGSPKAYMLHGYKLMGGGFKVSYCSYLAKEYETLLDFCDDDAIDCMKYLAKGLKGCILFCKETTPQRYEEICMAGREQLFDQKTEA
jgi:hypothetical protein